MAGSNYYLMQECGTLNTAVGSSSLIRTIGEVFNDTISGICYEIIGPDSGPAFTLDLDTFLIALGCFDPICSPLNLTATPSPTPTSTPSSYLLNVYSGITGQEACDLLYPAVVYSFYTSLTNTLSNSGILYQDSSMTVVVDPTALFADGTGFFFVLDSNSEIVDNPLCSVSPSPTPTPTSTLPSPTPTATSNPFLTCGSSYNGSYSPFTFAIQTVNLNLSSTPNGSSIFLNFTAVDRPNRFTIFEDGLSIYTTGYIGSTSSVPGPWNPPGFSPTGTTFTYDSSKTYYVSIDIAADSLTDSYRSCG